MAIYTLTRLLRLFSTGATKNRKKVESFTETSMLEILKIILLNNKTQGRDLSHWVEHLAETLENSGDPVKTFLGLVDNFKDLPRQFGESYVKSLRKNKTVADYVDYLLKALREQRDSVNGNKYSALLPLKLNSSERDVLIHQLKFISLCLTEQLNPNTSNWWDNEVQTTQVDWNKKIKSVKPIYLREIFSNILGYTV